MDSSRLLAFAVLFAGLALLAWPLFATVLQQAAERRSGDWALAGVTLLFMVVLIAAAWTVWFAETQPALLWPVAACILLFRFVSPIILLSAVSRRLGPPGSRGGQREAAVFGVTLVVGTYVLVSPTLGDLYGHDIVWSERLVSTLVVVYTFSQLYLGLFFRHMRHSPVLFAWLAGLLVGLGLVLLVPLYIDGFDAAFILVSSAGWLLAALLFQLHRRGVDTRWLRYLGFSEDAKPQKTNI